MRKFFRKCDGKSASSRDPVLPLSRKHVIIGVLIRILLETRCHRIGKPVFFPSGQICILRTKTDYLRSAFRINFCFLPRFQPCQPGIIRHPLKVSAVFSIYGSLHRNITVDAMPGRQKVNSDLLCHFIGLVLPHLDVCVKILRSHVQIFFSFYLRVYNFFHNP